MSLFHSLPHDLLKLILVAEDAAVELIRDVQRCQLVCGQPSTDETLTLLGGGTEEYTLLAKLKHLPLWKTIALVVLFVLLESSYYIFHIVFQNADEKALNLFKFLDIVLLPIAISFWFFAPVHSAFGQDREQDKLMLLDDSKARSLLTFFTLAVCISAVCESITFINHEHQVPALVIPFYVLSVFINVSTLFGSILLIALSFHVFVMRLELINVDVSLQVHGNSASSIKEPWVRSILKQYKSIREDIHHLAERFGLILFLGLFLYVVEVFNLVTKAWRKMGHDLSTFQTFVVLIDYMMDASILSIALYNMAYPTTLCKVHIGPKLSMLAVSARASGKQQSKSLEMLAQTFLLAPIQFHLGNFEMTPELADALTTAFIGLLLVMCGFHLPEL